MSGTDPVAPGKIQLASNDHKILEVGKLPPPLPASLFFYRPFVAGRGSRDQQLLTLPKRPAGC